MRETKAKKKKFRNPSHFRSCMYARSILRLSNLLAATIDFRLNRATSQIDSRSSQYLQRSQSTYFSPQLSVSSLNRETQRVLSQFSQFVVIVAKNRLDLEFFSNLPKARKMLVQNWKKKLRADSTMKN